MLLWDCGVTWFWLKKTENYHFHLEDQSTEIQKLVLLPHAARQCWTAIPASFKTIRNKAIQSRKHSKTYKRNFRLRNIMMQTQIRTRRKFWRSFLLLINARNSRKNSKHNNNNNNDDDVNDKRFHVFTVPVILFNSRKGFYPFF